MARSVTVLRGCPGSAPRPAVIPGAAIIAARPRSPPAAPPTSAPEHDPGRASFDPAHDPSRPACAPRSGPRAMPRIGLAMAHIELAKAEAAAIGRGDRQGRRLCRASRSRSSCWPSSCRRRQPPSSSASGCSARSGWGVLHGVLLLIAIAMVCVLAAVGMSGPRIGRAFVFGVLVAVIVGVILGFALPNQAVHRDRRCGAPGRRARCPAAGRGRGDLGHPRPDRRPDRVLRGDRSRAVASLALVGGVAARRRDRRHDRREDRAAGRCRHRHRRRLPHVDRPDGPRHRADRRRRRSAQGHDSPRPRRSRPARRRSRGYRARCRPGSGPSGSGRPRERARAPGGVRRGRRSISRPRSGAARRKAAAVVGALGFLALGARSGCSGRPVARSAASRAPMPKRMLPDEVEKTLRKLGDDGDKVAAALERDFAEYAKKAQQGPRGQLRSACCC